jgi:hypothetical protein
VTGTAAGGSFRGLPNTAIEMDFTIFLFSSVALAGVGLLVGGSSCPT